MYRLFCNSESIAGDKILITDSSKIHHIKDVLCLTLNERVIVCDERGNEYDTVIEKITSKDMRLKIKGVQKGSFIKKISITVACALPKKSKFDDIVDKLTQLGVERIVPMETERVIIKLNSDKKKMRLDRWSKIALSASEQSRRRVLPVIDPIKNIESVLSESRKYDLKLIPTLIDERITLKQILGKTEPKNILLLIGPEGDFTPQEVALAKNYGCIPVTLGEFVLRVETAAVAVVSMLNYALNASHNFSQYSSED